MNTEVVSYETKSTYIFILQGISCLKLLYIQFNIIFGWVKNKEKVIRKILEINPIEIVKA